MCVSGCVHGRKSRGRLEVYRGQIVVDVLECNRRGPTGEVQSLFLHESSSDIKMRFR